MPESDKTAQRAETGEGRRTVRAMSGDTAPRRKISASRQAELESRYETLSQREQEVLRGVAFGYTNREIAEHLGISVKSIETYRYRLSDKLDFGSRAELVRFALDLGVLAADGSGLPETT